MRASNWSMRARVGASGIVGRAAGVGAAGRAVASWRGWAAGGASCFAVATGSGFAGVTAATFFLAHPAPIERAATAIRKTPRERSILKFSIDLFITPFAAKSNPVLTGFLSAAI